MAILRQVIAVNCWLSAGIGVPANILLLWLILKRTPADMRAYARILLQTCLCDLALIVVQTLGQPVLVVDEGVNTALFLGPLQALQFPWSFAVFILWLFLFDTMMYQSGAQFYHRYFAVVRSHPISLGRYLFVLFLLPTIFTATIFCSALVGRFNGNPYTGGFLEPQLADFLGFSYSRNVNFAARGSGLIERIAIAINFSCFIVSYGLAAFCCRKTRSFVLANLKGPTRERDREVYRQMNRTLYVQGVIPLFSVFTSGIVTLCFSAQLGIFDDDPMVSASALAFALLPRYWLAAVNALVTITLVRTYRETAWALIRHLLGTLGDKCLHQIFSSGNPSNNAEVISNAKEHVFGEETKTATDPATISTL